MFIQPAFLLGGLGLAVAVGRYLHAGYAAAGAAVASRLRPRPDRPSDAALRLRGIEPQAQGHSLAPRHHANPIEGNPS